MSDTTDGPDADVTDDDHPADTPKTPSPRPRSAASRARRIGGAAASAAPTTPSRPGSDDGTATGAKVDVAKKPSGKQVAASTGKATSGKASSGKAASGKAPSGKAEPKASKAASEGDEDKKAALTLSVPGWVRWAPGFAFAATAVVFLVLFGVAHLGGDDAPASTSNSMRQEVLAAAKTCLATLNTYRYDALDQAEAAGAKCTTGKLTSDYKKTVTSVIRKNAPSLKAVQIAKINTAGIESVTANGKQWTILAYGQLNITTANLKQGRIDPFAVVARLQQVDGKWLLSKVDTVSSFSN